MCVRTYNNIMTTWSLVARGGYFHYTYSTGAPGVGRGSTALCQPKGRGNDRGRTPHRHSRPDKRTFKRRRASTQKRSADSCSVPRICSLRTSRFFVFKKFKIFDLSRFRSRTTVAAKWTEICIVGF